MIEDHVSNCLQLAMLLEVSAYPKPGNVHRTADFKNTKYEHFLATTIAIGEQFRQAAKIGIRASKKEIKFEQIGIGRMINDAVRNMMRWQSGGNTSLGVILLFLPMATATGIILGKGTFSIKKLRCTLDDVVKSTTHKDALDACNAIRTAKPGGLGKTQIFDLTDENVNGEIQRKKVNLFKLFDLSSKYDSIAHEWIGSYSVTFDIGHPYFCDCIEKSLDMNSAIVHTFMRILSIVPDSLIARKHGLKKAREVSNQAKEILELGGITTNEGERRLNQFDNHLRSEGLKVNPGTTADLTASTLALAILDGYRP